MELKHKALLTCILTCILTGAILFTGLVQAAEVYRWVDENGEVHYSETLPPDHQDKGHDVLNERGIVLDEDQNLTPPPPVEVPDKDEPQELPRDASGLPRAKALYSEVEMQNRMDNFLMLRYDNEQEITEAMNVEIQQLSYDRRLVETSRNSMEEAYRGQIKLAAERQRSGQQVTEATTAEINNLQANLASHSVSLIGLQQREDSIRTEFQKQLDRYRYLVAENAEDSSGP